MSKSQLIREAWDKGGKRGTDCHGYSTDRALNASSTVVEATRSLDVFFFWAQESIEGIAYGFFHGVT